MYAWYWPVDVTTAFFIATTTSILGAIVLPWVHLMKRQHLKKSFVLPLASMVFQSIFASSTPNVNRALWMYVGIIPDYVLVHLAHVLLTHSVKQANVVKKIVAEEEKKTIVEEKKNEVVAEKPKKEKPQTKKQK